MIKRNKKYWESLWSSKKKYGVNTKEMPWETGTHDENLEYAINYLNIKSGNILEIGCGSGIDSRYLDSLGFNVYSIDISEFAIKEAKKNKSSVFFEVGDINEFKTDKKFDIIYDRACLIYSKDNEKLFQNLSNMLNKNGHIIMINGNTNRESKNSKRPPAWSLSSLEEAIGNSLRVVLAKEVFFKINPLFGSTALGWLFILKNKQV
jgi:2-polyprenyl-3-methyl-5-hydroxy-6-metoxy-1,4-benzoquinol methylase